MGVRTGNPTWKDYPDTSTLVTAAKLNNIETVLDASPATAHTHPAADVVSGVLAAARIATGTPNGSKYLRDDQVWVTPPDTVAPDATPSVKGIVQLAGDLSGTAAAPTVPGLSGKAASVHTHSWADITTGTQPAPPAHTHTMAQVTDAATAIPAAVPASSETVQGKVELATAAETTTGTDATRAVHPQGLKVELDKKASLSHTHTKSEVGLPNVDNTSDANKPVSTAQAAADALAIQKSLVDAKGDLLVATANDTPARLALGTDTHVLTADSSQASGVKWAAAGGGAATGGILPVPGGYMWDFKRDFGSPVGAGVNGTAYLVPIAIGADCVINGLFMNVSGAGASGSLTRLGVYKADGLKGAPGTLVVDGGTVNSASTGNKEVDFLGGSAKSITAGIYWMVAAIQGGAATSPGYGGGNKTGKVPALPAAGDFIGPMGMLYATGITGAFPSTWAAGLTLWTDGDGLTMAARLG